MKDFVAIDFETANNYRTSVCSVGVVVVKDFKIVDKFYSLIKPYPNEYNFFTTKVHGLTQKDTCNARSFPEVWAEIAPKIGTLPLVAHNKSFDEKCLCSCFEHFGISHKDYTFYCTLQAARQKFPFLENHQLHTVSAEVGYDLANHHHALADAEACAAIAIQIL